MNPMYLMLLTLPLSPVFPDAPIQQAAPGYVLRADTPEAIDALFRHWDPQRPFALVKEVQADIAADGQVTTAERIRLQAVIDAVGRRANALTNPPLLAQRTWATDDPEYRHPALLHSIAQAQRAEAARADARLPTYSITERDEGSAVIAARHWVKKQLLAPRTAKFSDTWWDPRGAERVSKMSGEYDGCVKVFGWVDAQNAFGATLRKHYTCILKKTRRSTASPLESWLPIDIAIDR